MALPWKLERVAMARTALEAEGRATWATGAMRTEDMVAAIFVMEMGLGERREAWSVLSPERIVLVAKWQISP
eukprot:534032-Pyramimonas_sp.AAC.1